MLQSWRLDQSGITIVTHGSNGLRVELLDISGRLIRACASSGHSISLPRASMPRGVLLVRVMSEKSGISETVRLRAD
jgi:hypothetical protein